MKQENDSDINRNLCTLNNPQRIGKILEALEIRGRVETIKSTTILRSARILRRVLDTWEDFLSLKLQWKTIN